MTVPEPPSEHHADQVSDGSAPGYAAAVAELDRILLQLDSSQMDVDLLGDHVARAAELIAICRDRIDAARMRVTEIVADLDEAPDLDADPG
jgi:exodeoxyribonuclease VII small subunit